MRKVQDECPGSTERSGPINRQSRLKTGWITVHLPRQPVLRWAQRTLFRMARFEVVIVGAGPAGSWTAFRLARAGMRVAILDGSHPREKPCGGGITGRALQLVRTALLPASVPSVRINRATFNHKSCAAQVELSGDSLGYPPLVVACRRDFDKALLSAAIAAGAEHQPVRVTGVRSTAAGWTIETRHGATEARWVVGADGANSLVRRHVARAFSREELSIATGYFIHGRSSRDIVVSFEDEPAGYLWSFPRPDHLAVGICAQADQSSSSALRAQVDRWIAQNLVPGGALERYSWPIPSLGERSLARERSTGPGWILVGDAAGLVDPITREGIYFALQSADIAADALIRGAHVEAEYLDRLRSEIHGELARAARLKARFFQPRVIGLLVNTLGRSARIRGVMADLVAGRQPYDGLRRRLFQTLEWRLMVELFGY
jgi:geranylgeranyl reductase family protein